jgi:hypothetical protein
METCIVTLLRVVLLFLMMMFWYVTVAVDGGTIVERTDRISSRRKKNFKPGPNHAQH